MEGNLDDKKSTLGYLFTFAGEIYHGSKKCKSVLPYLQLRLSILQRMKQYIEMISQSTLDLSENATFHSHLKYIEVRYHSIRLVVEVLGGQCSI